jgi:hypothetical protein
LYAALHNRLYHLFDLQKNKFSINFVSKECFNCGWKKSYSIAYPYLKNFTFSNHQLPVLFCPEYLLARKLKIRLHKLQPCSILLVLQKFDAHLCSKSIYFISLYRRAISLTCRSRPPLNIKTIKTLRNNSCTFFDFIC